MKSLATRMLAFLERHEGEWISKRELAERARKVGFTYDQTSLAFAAIDATIHVGIRYENGAWYRWYAMSEEEKQKHREQLEYFDSLPDAATETDSGMAPMHSL